MSEETVVRTITRRRVLTGVGSGVAVAWAAPVVLSMQGVAYAASAVSCDPASSCAPYACNSLKGACDPDGAGSCFCSGDVDGHCFCWNDGSCASTTLCTATSECPQGWACVFNCCNEGEPAGTGACFPPCGTPLQSSTIRGSTIGGQTSAPGRTGARS